MSGKNHSPYPLPRWQGSQRRIGLTGGIASGKSSVGKYLKDIKGLPTIDADIYAREALEPGTITTQEIVKRYGKSILDKNLTNQISINRSTLSQIIFKDKKERLWLEQLIHPLVIKQLQLALDSEENIPTYVLIIPLLFEAKLTRLCSEIWVVSCTPEQQLKRLLARNPLTLEEAKARIRAQWDIGYKAKLADVVIDNTGSHQSWIEQVNSLL